MQQVQVYTEKPVLKVKVLSKGLVSQLLNTRGEVNTDPDPLAAGESIVGYCMSGVGVLVQSDNGNLRLCHAYRLHAAQVAADRTTANLREWVRSLPQLFLA